MKTAYAPVELIDPAPPLDQALGSALTGLSRAAIQIGAGAVAVLLIAGSRVEVTHFWSVKGDDLPAASLSNLAQAGFDALKTRSGFIEAESLLAQFLRDVLSRHERSFLLFPRIIRQSAITVVFCFANPQPRYRTIPDGVRETLDLIGLATWSVKEVARLQVELRTVSTRLAGRKLVERAKGLLQVDQGFTEERAYEYLRRLSRQRRITLVELADEIVREFGRRAASSPSVREPRLAS